jgi:hypothetical protein
MTSGTLARRHRFRFLIRNRDARLMAAFDEVLTTDGVRIVEAPQQALSGER